jgi:hypothetical protein
MQSLRSFHKPVGVWEATVRDDLGIPPRLGRNCFRAYSSSGNAARMALDILHAAGHRSIALAVSKVYNADPWFTLRHNVLVEHAQSYHDTTTIAVVVMSELPGMASKVFTPNINVTQSMLEHIENINRSYRGNPDDGEAIKQRLKQDMPELERLVSQRGQTAVIAANDEVATDFVMWMNYTGRSVPADMSLISFDNNPSLVVHRFSSMDFAFADLGYLVAHRFIGDIPVHKDANGNITVTPRFFDRGSILALSTRRKVS